MKPHTRLLTFALLVVVLLLIGARNVTKPSSVAQPPAQISTPPPDITCDQLVTLAETSVGLVCDGLGRNKACYGNHLISAEFQPNTNATFTKSGDTADLLDIKRLSTTPFNLQTHDWGIAVIKAQANLPDALPGQNVTFLLYGDTTVDNPSPDMHAVTVSTRIGSNNCTTVPDSAVLIQSPSGSQVAMHINGVDVTLGSTAYVTAQQNQNFTFAIVEGMGTITSQGVSRTVPPGAEVQIPLGGPDGLQSNGAPSDLMPFDLPAIQLAPLKLLDRKVTIPPPFQPGQQPPASDTPTPTPTAATATCTPRADWPYRYVIQPGDTLPAIALKLNMPTADLQAGNCIATPARLIAGQSLHVPHPAPTATRAPTPTFTPPPPVQASMTGPNLRADKNPIYGTECTTIRWDLENIKAVYFEGQPTTGHSSKQVCPTATTTYTLMVQTLDGQQHPYPITITVLSSD